MRDKSRDAVDSKGRIILLTNPPLGFTIPHVTRSELSEAARLLGKKKSLKKAKASRENGKLGGRPRKKRKAA